MADRQDADVFEEVQAFNDHGKVLAGVHENFLAVRFNDPTLCKVCSGVNCPYLVITAAFFFCGCAVRTL